MTKYKFGIKENKDLGFQAVVLNDDTHIVIGDSTVSIGYPKKKFSRIFRAQMKDRKKKYLFIEWSGIELNAIMKGLELLMKKNKQQHPNEKKKK